MKDKQLNLFLALTGATIAAGAPELGQITVSNSTQNYAGSLAQDVQGYLAGLPSSDDSAMLDMVAPGLQVNDFFQFAKSDDEAYLTEVDDSDIRAAGASFKRVQYRGTTATDATQQKGLTMRVDHKTLPKVGSVIVPGWENRYAASLKNRLVRADLVRALAVIEAAAVSNNVGITFSGATNPDGLLRAMVQLSRTAIGDTANLQVLIGNASWQGRQDSYENATRVNTGVVNHSDYDEVMLARYLRVKRVIICDAIKQTGKGVAKADIAGLVNYCYAVTDSPMIDDPSNIKRCWSPVTGGGEWAVAIQESAVYTDITVWHESKIIAPITAGFRKTTVTVS
jgi:hypothetical protein